jgi:outer-membrane receptor for ferric coprogen and ferric-rhodotorulic acid
MLTGHGIGVRSTMAPDPVNAVAFEFTEPGRAAWGLFGEYRFLNHSTIALNVNNIFDRQYCQKAVDAGWGNVYGEPRNWMFTLRHRL